MVFAILGVSIAVASVCSVWFLHASKGASQSRIDLNAIEPVDRLAFAAAMWVVFMAATFLLLNLALALSQVSV